MKKTTKALLLVLCAVLLVAGSVMGTLAYLTSQDEVKNTFTVGKVEINLDEVAVDEDGNPTQNRTEVGNAYHLLPGKLYSKEPAITVLANSEDCYVRAKITVTVPNWNHDGKVEDTFDNFASSFAEIYIQNDYTGNGFNTSYWTPSALEIDADNKTITYYLTYKSGSDDIVESSDYDYMSPSLFNDIYVPDTLDNTTLSYLEGMTINVEAHAIQAGGFENATAAWDAFDAQ